MLHVRWTKARNESLDTHRSPKCPGANRLMWLSAIFGRSKCWLNMASARFAGSTHFSFPGDVNRQRAEFQWSVGRHQSSCKIYYTFFLLWLFHAHRWQFKWLLYDVINIHFSACLCCLCARALFFCCCCFNSVLLRLIMLPLTGSHVLLCVCRQFTTHIQLPINVCRGNRGLEYRAQPL